MELADGTLINNMRSYGDYADYRKISTSTDGGHTWSEVQPDFTLIEPTCQASFLRYTLARELDKNRVLFSNPASTSSRNKMTVRLSYDEGETWPVSREIYAGSSAYSCLSILPDWSVACFYERDSYDKITCARFSLEWLTMGADQIDEFAAHNPISADQTGNLTPPVQLRWLPGRDAVSHRIYLGKTPQPGPAEFKTDQVETAYDATALEYDTTYYWRIDEVQADDTVVPGHVWSFTTLTPDCDSPPPGDCNRDCIVNLEDFTIMAAHWLMDRKEKE